jgi:hypothetical protein
MGLSSYVTCLLSFAGFNILSLFYMMSVLIMSGGYFFFSPDSLVFCQLPIPVWPSLSWGWISFQLLFYWTAIYGLVFISLLLCPWFVVVAFSLASKYLACSIHIFVEFFLSLFTVWQNSSTLSSIPDILFSTCSTLFPSFWLRYLFGILSCLFQIDYFLVSISLLISSFMSWIVFLTSFIWVFVVVFVVISLSSYNYLLMSF